MDGAFVFARARVDPVSCLFSPRGEVASRLNASCLCLSRLCLPSFLAGKIVAPVDSSNPIQVDAYASGAWAALPNYVANEAAQYMTTVASTATPQ